MKGRRRGSSEITQQRQASAAPLEQQEPALTTRYHLVAGAQLGLTEVDDLGDHFKESGSGGASGGGGASRGGGASGGGSAAPIIYFLLSSEDEDEGGDLGGEGASGGGGAPGSHGASGGAPKARLFLDAMGNGRNADSITCGPRLYTLFECHCRGCYFGNKPIDCTGFDSVQRMDARSRCINDERHAPFAAADDVAGLAERSHS
jgi:hypothetical protein